MKFSVPLQGRPSSWLHERIVERFPHVPDLVLAAANAQELVFDVKDELVGGAVLAYVEILPGP